MTQSPGPVPTGPEHAAAGGPGCMAERARHSGTSPSVRTLFGGSKPDLMGPAVIGQVKGWQWLKSWRLDELVPNPGHEAVAWRMSSKGSGLDPLARSLQQQQPRLWSYTSRASSSCVLLRTRKDCRSRPGCQRIRWLRSTAAVGMCSWATSTPPSVSVGPRASRFRFDCRQRNCMRRRMDEWLDFSSMPRLEKAHGDSFPAQPQLCRHSPCR